MHKAVQVSAVGANHGLQVPRCLLTLQSAEAGLHYQAEDEYTSTLTPSAQAQGVWMWRHTNLQPDDADCARQYRSALWLPVMSYKEFDVCLHCSMLRQACIIRLKIRVPPSHTFSTGLVGVDVEAH